MRRARHLLIAVATLLLAGCASSTRLAQQSDEALARGDLRTAYEKARRALDKEPANTAARGAFANAATQLADDFKGRVLRLAEVDTIAAARMALDFRGMRAEFSRYPVALPDDAPYGAREARIVDAAARIRYVEAGRSLEAGRPKEAVRRYEECVTFVPGFRDADARAAGAMERAIARHAVLPFENGVDVPGLGHELARRIGDELVRRAGSPAFRFTRAMTPGELDEKLTVAQARGLTREQAVALGRRLGVARVVCGRLSGMRSHSATEDRTVPIWHRTLEKQDDGSTAEHWEREEMRVIDRLRTVAMTCTWELVAVSSGEVLASRTESSEAAARIVWSDFIARGDCDDYALVTPEMRTADARGADARHKDFRKRYGDRTLPQFLEGVRTQRDQRARYQPRFRDEFHADTRARPVFLGGLPDEDELARVALRDVWRPVIGRLQELDPLD